MADPAYLNPFILPIKPVTSQRHGHVDIYRPSAEGRRPAVVFIPGGPLPATLEPRPRAWPLYAGYGSLAAASGLVGATLDHRLYNMADHAPAAEDVHAAVARVRADPSVDPERVLLWFFSGGGRLSADFLREPPSWLRGIALTYPVLGDLPSRAPAEPRFRPIETMSGAGDLPILLVKAGLERAELAVLVDSFIAAAQHHQLNLEVIDLPNARHGFEHLEPTEEARAGVERAMTWVTKTLSPNPPAV